MTRPNLFLAGAPKCGTTSMYAYLKAHPDIFMAERKEPHYFGRDFIRQPLNAYQQITNEAGYLALFKAARDERYVGEASTTYFYSHTAADEMYAFNPAARVIIMLRNPVDMMYAMYYELRSHGFEPLPSFAAALDAESERRRGENLPDRVYIRQSLFYREMSRYAVHVERFLAAFGREQVHIIIFDDFKADTAATYQAALDFLGLRAFQPDFRVANASKTTRSTALRSFLQSPPAPVLALGQRMLPVARPVYRALRQFNTQPLDRPAMPPDLYHQLQIELRPEIERLSALLDRDLTHWCQRRDD